MADRRNIGGGDSGIVPVVHLITRLELGGAQENTLYTVSHLDRRRFQPCLLTGVGGLLDDEARALEGVEVCFLPNLVREIRPLRDLLALKEIYSCLKDIRRRHAGPMIVHTHSSKAGILGRWAARLAGAGIIIHSIHGFGFTPGQPAPVRAFFLGLEWLTATITSAFIAVSRANAEEGVNLGLFGRDRVHLINSGIEVERFSSPQRRPDIVRRDLGLPPYSPLVGMIGCFKPQKAPVDFVRVAHLVSKGRDDAHFLMIGDGMLRLEVERAVAAGNLGGRLHILGWRRDIPDILHALDVLVLTSRWEGLPRVLPQALAAGVPVVANAVDGVPEAVLEGRTGYLVGPGELQAMAERILSLIDEPLDAATFGRESARLLEGFDARRMVREQEDLYNKLLGQNYL